MRILNDHFEWVAPPRISEVVHPTFGAVSRKDLTEAQALKLWQAGFPHLAITEEGRKFHGLAPANAGAPRPAPAPPPEPAAEEAAEETGGTPASAGATPEEADERPRKRGRRGNDTPEREGAAE
jgi:hypothetical protein